MCQDVFLVADPDPDLAAEAFNRGLDLFEDGEFDAAIDEFYEAIRLDPAGAVDALVARGKAFAGKGDLRDAIAD